MESNNNKIKVLFIVLAFFVCSFLIIINNSFSIYKTTLNTTFNLTVLDPTGSIPVTLDLNDGTGNTIIEYRVNNQTLGNITSPTRTNYNFLGWYDGTSENANRIYSDQIITGPVTYYAHWQKIICKKVTTQNKLHTETCASSGSAGCRVTAINISPGPVTYGTTYTSGSPIAGDAYDCDVNNDGTYDGTTQYGKYTERFYFLRTVDNGNAEQTGALIYYTVVDSTGPVDTQHTNKNNIGSTNYNDSLAWLPTKTTSNTLWNNPGLKDFDNGNGKITRLLNFSDLSAVCGPIDGVQNPSYFADCEQWFLFENSRFQSADSGRAGMWLAPVGNTYYRIQTQTIQVGTVDSTSANTIRPVIEIPLSAFEGYKNVARHTVTFNTHGGSPQIPTRMIYDGDPLGTINTVTKEHFAFDGWYASYSNDVYSNPVNAATTVENNMTLYAKWNPVPTSTVTFDAHGGNINGESTYDLIVDTGHTIDEEDIPEAQYAGHSFAGWYYDDELTLPYDETEPITDDTTLYADWIIVNPVARVNNVDYDTLAEAIEAVPTDKVKTTVTLLRDVTLEETVTIPDTKYVELAGGSYIISGTGNLINNKGYLDIISGTLSISNTTAASVIITNVSGARLNISGGTISSSGTTITNTLITNASGATLNITGGTLANNCYVVNATTEFLVITNSGTTTISGGSITSHGQSASINQNGGTLNVSGGEIIAHNSTKGQAIYIAGGTANISDGAYLENLSGTGESRACVDNNGGTLNITGGTIVSKGYSAVIVRKNGTTTQIGTSDSIIDISNPVLRGKRYGFEKQTTVTNATIKVYDGLFESLNQTQAISTTDVTKPDNISFKTDATVSVEGVTYNAAYLLAPSITINFYEETNGTAIPVIVDNGIAIGNNLPTPNPKQGYYFAGWFIDGNSLYPVTSATVVTGTFNAYAKWVQSVSNATFDDTMTIHINTTDTISFVEDDIEDVTYLSSDTTVVTVDSDGTVHAVGAGTATITMTGTLSGDTETIDVTVIQIMRTIRFYDADYNPNDLEHSTLIDTVQVVSGSTIGVNMPTNPTDTNYVFNAWYINGNSTTLFTSETVVTGDINVVANWKEKLTYATLSTTPSPFVIGIGGTGQISLTATVQGDTVEDCTFASAEPNYATVNSTTGEVTGIDIGDTYITVTGNLSGTTVQVPISVDFLRYTVTFKDGSNVIKTVQVESGSSVGSDAMPPNQTKPNYVFNGWVYENNNSLTPFTSATEVYGNIDVIVSWKEKISIATLPSNPTSVLLGSSKQVLVTAAGEGNIVEDYTLFSSDSDILEVFGKTITGSSLGSVTLTITGTESHESETITVNVVNTYNVTFDPDNGSTPSVIQVGVGSSIDDSGVSLPLDPTKPNYVFDNWYLYDETNETLTTTRLNTSTNVTSDITYKAKWVSDTYYVAVYGSTTTYHTTLQDAFNSAPTSGVATEVKILQNIVNPTGQSKVMQGRNVILNGGSHSVTCGQSTTNQMIFNESGTLRVVSGTYSCGKSTLATFQNGAKRTLYIDGGLIENTNDRGAIYNEGVVIINGGTLTSVATERGVVQNAGGTSSITMYGGTVNQLASSSMGALHNGKSGSRITITGGTVTSIGNAIQNISGTTLVVGTEDDEYDTTSPVIQGDLYGITSTVAYSVYDGFIKGKSSNQAVNDFSKITQTEDGSERRTGTEGSYYTLYYEIPNTKYHIDFNANNGQVTPTYKDFDLNEEITTNDLPTPTRENHTFDGWYTDSNLQTPFAAFTPTATDNVTYYAKWTFNPSYTPVTHNVLSNAMQEYFTNVSSWVAADATDPSNESPQSVAPQTKEAAANYDNGHHLFKNSINQVFTNNGCSSCGENNSCNNPGTGVYCDQPDGYDTGLTEDVNVYLYENGTKGSLVTYTTSTGGKIYNMIPGVTYLWESTIDNTKYGVVTATGNRRTLKTSIRNLRDLGGLSASNSDVSGTIDYGRLYRGAYISSAQGITDLTKLGITREVDLRSNGDGFQTYKMPNYDTGTSSNYTDIIITNYVINPIPTTYILSDQYLSNYRNVKSAIRSIMEKVVFNHDSVFLHCTIGTDRTGTIAYFLEGLLGVSEEDRLRDYEMTYFFGLTNRTRFHDSVSWSGINPRFYSMYRSYPTNQDIYNYYKYEPHVVDQNNPNDLTDDELLRRFRLELIH